MADKVPLYTLVHKGQRRTMALFSNQTSTMDFKDPGAVDHLRDQLVDFQTGIHEHAQLEEQFIHPLLRERVPGAATKIENEHIVVHRMLAELVTNLDSIRAKPLVYDMRRDLGQEFYLAWSRFIAFYLGHIDYEEEMLQRLLWDLSTTEDLARCFANIIISQSPHELAQNLRMIIPALSEEEQVELFRGAKAIVPPPVFESALQLAEEVLGPGRWSVLADSIGVVRQAI
jgi:hypothetical protein